MPQVRVAGGVNQSRLVALRDDDVVEMPGNLESALFTVGAVSYTEALLHAGLPGPRVDGVLAADVPPAAAWRGRHGARVGVCGVALAEFEAHGSIGVVHGIGGRAAH